MGKVIAYKCICGYEERTFLGAGFRAMSIELISKYFPQEGQFISEHKDEVKPYLIKSVLGECLCCKKLQSISSLEYTYNDEACVKHAACPTCDGAIKVIENVEDVKCPRCDNIMEYANIGHWD